MAQAALRGFNISKPWGDSAAWDVGVDRGLHFLRVQVKSTADRTGTGYICELKPNHRKTRDYTLDQVDLFAAYVVPVSAWYLIPASVILGPRRKTRLMLFPVDRPRQDNYKCECYREAWGLLGKSRSELARHNQPR